MHHENCLRHNEQTCYESQAYENKDAYRPQLE